MLLKSLYPKLTNKTMIITASILLILGQILNVICPHHLFHVNQIMLLAMLLLEFMVIKHIQAGTEELKQSIKESEVFHSFISIVEYSSKEPIKSLGVLYSLKTLADLLSGSYCFDSFFYDTDNWTSRINDSTFEKVKKSPEQWALVLCNYHN